MSKHSVFKEIEHRNPDLKTHEIHTWGSWGRTHSGDKGEIWNTKTENSVSGWKSESYSKYLYKRNIEEWMFYSGFKQSLEYDQRTVGQDFPCKVGITSSRHFQQKLDAQSPTLQSYKMNSQFSSYFLRKWSRICSTARNPSCCYSLYTHSCIPVSWNPFKSSSHLLFQRFQAFLGYTSSLVIISKIPLGVYMSPKQLLSHLSCLEAGSNTY